MVAMPQQTDGEIYAKSHGTTWNVYKAAGWRDGVIRRGRPAIEFTTSTGKRYRFTDDQKPKYDQDSGYEMCWYGLQRAVKMAKLAGLPFIVDCNGAPSTVPAQHKGLPAFSLQSGEGAHPKPHLIEELKKLWHGSIIVAMDCDEAGRKGAITRVQDYHKAGFNAVAVDLALPNDGGDLADFVAIHEKPVEAIQALEHIVIPEIVEKQKLQFSEPTIETFEEECDKAQRALDALASWRRDSEPSWFAVGAALYELGSVGFSLWENWSRTSEKFKDGECDKKWKHFKPLRTLKSLYKWADEDSGTTWRPYKAPPVRAKADLTIEIESVPAKSFDWSNGVPFGIRAALNLYAESPVAPVLELWIETINTGMCDQDDPVDIEFLKCAAESLGRNLSDMTIRRGVNLGCGQFLSKMSHNIYILDSNSDTTIKSDKSDRNPSQCQPPLKAGRKAELYKLLPIPEIVANVAKLAVTPILEKAFPIENSTIAPIRTEFLAELGCEPEQAKELSAALSSKYDAILKAQPNYGKALERARWEYKRFVRNLTNNASHPIPKGMEYKAGCARALIEYHGGEMQFSRQALADKIGCTFRNLNAVLKRGGIYMHKEQYCEQPIKSVTQLGAIEHQYNAECKGFPVRVVSSSGNKRMFKAKHPKLLQWAGSEISGGFTLTIQYRQANRQSLEPPTKPDKPKPDTEHQEYAQPELPKPLSALERFFVARAFRQLVEWLSQFAAVMGWLKYFFTWMLSRHLLPKEHKPTYAEQWVAKLTEKAAPVEPTAIGLALADTGELLDTPQQMLDVLATCEPPPPPDPLLDALVMSGAKIIEITEAKDDRHNDVGRIQERTQEIST